MLSDISNELSRVVLTIFIILGTFGNCLNLIIFFRPALYRSSCTLYLIATSIANLLVMFTTLLTRLLRDGYNIDPTSSSNVFCKLRYCVGYIFLSLSPYFFTLACFDRYCSSSTLIDRRSWCHQRVAKQLILGISILTCVLYSHMAVFFEIYMKNPSTPYCYSRPGLYSLIYSIFFLIAYCLLPPFFMALFSILTLMNIRRQARRILPVSININPHRRLNTQLIRMLFTQVFSQFICSLPFALMNILNLFITTNLATLNFITQLSLISIYFSYVSSFYIFTLSSRIYRDEFAKIVRKCLRRG